MQRVLIVTRRRKICAVNGIVQTPVYDSFIALLKGKNAYYEPSLLSTPFTMSTLITHSSHPSSLDRALHSVCYRDNTRQTTLVDIAPRLQVAIASQLEEEISINLFWSSTIRGP